MSGSAPRTPPRSKTVPRPPLSPTRPDSPSSVSTLSAAAAGSPRRPLTPTPNNPNPTPTQSSVTFATQQRPEEPSTTPIVDRPSRRARDLLRQHYGLGIGPPPASQGPAHPLDPMNMDSTAFEARSYYEQLITTSSLPSLLKRENDLLSEMRQLDSERQSLVYNHHHELIAASDTIAAMKDRAEGLDNDLEKLKVAFSEISRISFEVMGNDLSRRGSAASLTTEKTG